MRINLVVLHEDDTTRKDGLYLQEMDGIPNLIQAMHMSSGSGNKKFAMDESFVCGIFEGNWDLSRLCIDDHPS